MLCHTKRLLFCIYRIVAIHHLNLRISHLFHIKNQSYLDRDWWQCRTNTMISVFFAATIVPVLSIKLARKPNAIIVFISLGLSFKTFSYLKLTIDINYYNKQLNPFWSFPLRLELVFQLQAKVPTKIKDLLQPIKGHELFQNLEHSFTTKERNECRYKSFLLCTFWVSIHLRKGFQFQLVQEDKLVESNNFIKITSN